MEKNEGGGGISEIYDGDRPTTVAFRGYVSRDADERYRRRGRDNLRRSNLTIIHSLQKVQRSVKPEDRIKSTIAIIRPEPGQRLNIGTPTPQNPPPTTIDTWKHANPPRTTWSSTHKRTIGERLIVGFPSSDQQSAYQKIIMSNRAVTLRADCPIPIGTCPDVSLRPLLFWKRNYLRNKTIFGPIVG